MQFSKMKDCPFFWNLIGERRIEDIFEKYDAIQGLTVCSAYISEYGVDVLRDLIERNNLSKKKVRIYISKEFSNRNCHIILEELNKISNVKIYSPKENVMFHPKMIILKSEEDGVEYVIGSSNFTKGGLHTNVEMSILNEATEIEKKYLKQFVDMVDYKSISVDEKLIERYKESEKDIEVIQSLRKTIYRKYTNIFLDEVDSFQEGDYDFSDQYFKYNDYEVFFTRNQELMEVEHRSVVQEKLLELHKTVLKRIAESNMEIAPHWSTNHVTSLTTPQIFNHYRVGWMGVRYGKYQSELENFWDAEGKSEYEGFQKHACLQYSIGEDSFSVNLFHAVPYDAHDRHYLHESLLDVSFQEKLIEVLERIEGINATWYIGDMAYDFNTDSAKDFIEFYKENDEDGYHSYLAIEYNVDSDEISNSKIIDTIMNDFELLYPIYKVVVKRY